jgi:S1-C subfamily serine protease
MKALQRTASVLFLSLVSVFLICSSIYSQTCFIRCEPDKETGGGACGSGFFISKNEILTAAHVIDDANNIRIEFDGKYFKAFVVRQDATKDLALLRIEEEHDKFYKLSDSFGKADQKVTCFGFPRGVWTLYKSSGVIKEVNSVTRDSRYKDNPRMEYGVLMEVTNGMSGGPLLTEDKTVIGVLSSKNIIGEPRANFIALEDIKKFLD